MHLAQFFLGCLLICANWLNQEILADVDHGYSRVLGPKVGHFPSRGAVEHGVMATVAISRKPRACSTIIDGAMGLFGLSIVISFVSLVVSYCEELLLKIGHSGTR